MNVGPFLTRGQFERAKVQRAKFSDALLELQGICPEGIDPKLWEVQRNCYFQILCEFDQAIAEWKTKDV